MSFQFHKEQTPRIAKHLQLVAPSMTCHKELQKTNDDIQMPPELWIVDGSKGLIEWGDFASGKNDGWFLIVR